MPQTPHTFAPMSSYPSPHVILMLHSMHNHHTGRVACLFHRPLSFPPSAPSSLLFKLEAAATRGGHYTMGLPLLPTRMLATATVAATLLLSFGALTQAQVRGVVVVVGGWRGRTGQIVSSTRSRRGYSSCALENTLHAHNHNHNHGPALAQSTSNSMNGHHPCTCLGRPLSF